MQNIGFESSNKIEKINSDINVMQERKINNEQNAERFEKEITEITEKIKELEEEKKQKQDKKVGLNQNREKFEKELSEKQAQLEEITKKLTSKELEIEDKKQKVEQDVDKKYEVASEINTQDINFENLEKRQKTIKQEIQTAISELDSARMKKQELSKGFYDSFVNAVEIELGKPVQTGVFGAEMMVELVNDGLVTILIDTKNRE